MCRILLCRQNISAHTRVKAKIDGRSRGAQQFITTGWHSLAEGTITTAGEATATAAAAQNSAATSTTYSRLAARLGC